MDKGLSRGALQCLAVESQAWKMEHIHFVEACALQF